MASGGVGSPQHLYGELFKSMTGVNMLHVPYRGGNPAMTDLLAGHADVMFEPIATAIEHVKAGGLRALAVTYATRWHTLPELPAIAESVPGYEATGWIGLGAPRGTPSPIVEKLNSEMNAGLNESKMRTRIEALMSVPMPMSTTEFARYVVDYTNKWTKIIREAKIKAE
jgi:tripartite-type tricarboxylate transporter receptor subunit TctC